MRPGADSLVGPKLSCVGTMQPRMLGRNAVALLDLFTYFERLLHAPR